MQPITLGQGVALHADGLQSTNVLAYGAPGAGKTTILRLICERAPERFQQILIDTEDELATLRVTGRDYTILGGEDADVPGLEKMDWQQLGASLNGMGANFIFQIGEWSIGQQRSFVGALVTGLLRTPRDKWRPMIFGLDESDMFAPNGAAFASTDPLVNLAKRGRKRGWSCLFATQRMSLLSADVRGMCSNLAIGLANQTLDVKAAAAMIGVGPTSAEAKGLKSLRRGDFWVYGPAFGGGEPTLVHFERSQSRSPEPGSQAMPPTRSNKAVAKMLAGLVKVEEEPEAEAAPAHSERVVYRTDPAIIAEATQAAAERAAAQVAEKLRRFADRLAAGEVKLDGEFITTMTADTAVTPDSHRVVKMHVNGHDTMTVKMNIKADGETPYQHDLAPRHIKLLDAVRFWESIGFKQPTREQVAAIAGISHRTGNFSNMLTALRQAEAIETPTGAIALTASGRALTKPPARGNTVRERVDLMLQPRHRRVLDVLPRDGSPMTREALAKALDISERTGNFSNLLTFLRTRALITTPTGGVAVQRWVWR